MKKLYLYRDAGSIPVDQFLRTLPDSQRVHLLWQIAKLLPCPTWRARRRSNIFKWSGTVAYMKYGTNFMIR